MSPILRPLWRPAPADLTVSDADVHLWRACLDQPAWRVRQLARLLSSDERARAERFHFARDKHHFIVGRGLLRAILGRYLGLSPQRLEFRYGSHGKPALAGIGPGGGVRFNLSHAHGLVLYGFTQEREIGVDLERIRPIPDAEQIAARFFSAHENGILRALPQGQQAAAFLHCWTRKEAYLKAIGDGLARPLDRFDVSLAPGEPARLLRVAGDPQEVARWCLQALRPAEGYVAALAVQGHGWHLACWEGAEACVDEVRSELTREPEGP